MHFIVCGPCKIKFKSNLSFVGPLSSQMACHRYVAATMHDSQHVGWTKKPHHHFLVRCCANIFVRYPTFGAPHELEVSGNITSGNYPYIVDAHWTKPVRPNIRKATNKDQYRKIFKKTITQN